MCRESVFVVFTRKKLKFFGKNCCLLPLCFSWLSFAWFSLRNCLSAPERRLLHPNTFLQIKLLLCPYQLLFHYFYGFWSRNDFPFCPLLEWSLLDLVHKTAPMAVTRVLQTLKIAFTLFSVNSQLALKKLNAKLLYTGHVDKYMFDLNLCPVKV